MSRRKSKVDNGYLAASTNAHIGEALGADRQDLEEFSAGHGRRGLLEHFRALGQWVLAHLPKFRKHHQQ